VKIGRALLILKKSELAQLAKGRSRGAARMRRLLEQHDRTVERIEPAHDEHAASVELVRSALAERRIEWVERNEIPERPIRGYDLVIPVGGDGTLLSASHALRNNIPILGVNSAPQFSVGFLTGCTAGTFGDTLDRLLTGELEPCIVQRLRLKLGDKVIAAPVLNDVLFCADNPAVMTRYRLVWPDGEELQRSSGVWISTPAGSTSALASAGGPALPLTAKQFAFLAREPYSPPGSSVRYRTAVLDGEQVLEIECRTDRASVFLDGSHRRYPVAYGETVSFGLHSQPLRLVRTKR
jgi:NAD+ kinase